MLGAQLGGILNNRNRAGYTLISAAGINDDRHLAAVHSGIGGGSRHSLCPDTDIIALQLQKGLAHVGAIVTPDALIGNGGVIFYLALQKLANIFKLGCSCKIPCSGRLLQQRC